jgi:uncharacterized protein (TIGR03437 family)
MASIAVAQQYVISTMAGGTPPPTPAAALNTSIGDPHGVATDAAGNVYFTSLYCVFKLDTSGTLTRVAGNSRPGDSGDGGPATSAEIFESPGSPGNGGLVGVTVDGSGNLYIADRYGSRVRRVSNAGIITTVAGNGTTSYSGGGAPVGDGGPAASAELFYPQGVAVDRAGNLYIAAVTVIRKVSPAGIITTMAGGGTGGLGDGGPATSASLGDATGLAVDGSGNLYIADTSDFRVRRVSNAGIITTVAGNGTQGHAGDGGPATSAELFGPAALAVDSAGNLYIADDYVIRKVSPAGIITTVAGGGAEGLGDGGPATSASLGGPQGVAVDGTGNLYIADVGHFRIRKVSTAGVITTVAGNGDYDYTSDGGPATGAPLASPGALAVDASKNLYITDSYNQRVRKVSSDGIITTVAGNGTAGYSGDGGPPTSAELYFPAGVAVGSDGSLYIADSANSRIRKVSGGVITTVAGGGSNGLGDGGPATSAQLGGPGGVAVDGSGNLYIADTDNNSVRKVSPDGTISTVAGNGTAGYTGDGGPATGAELYLPSSVAVDGSKNLYIADPYNFRVRKVSPDGIITTFAGGGTGADGGPAIGALLNYPSAVALDGSGNLYIAEELLGRVRMVSPAGTITTVAGRYIYSYPYYSGDGGPATNATLLTPTGIAVDGSGRIFLADGEGNAVRVLTPTSQSVLVAAVLDGASESAAPVSPGKIVVIYGGGLGPTTIIQNQPANGVYGTQVAGTTVSFNGYAAPIIYSYATQVAVIAPYEIAGSPTAQVIVTYQGQTSAPLTVPVAASAPSLFSLNWTGAGQAVGYNLDGSVNDAAHPAEIGGYVSLYATGEGQTSPAGVDGKVASTQPYPQPLLPVNVTVGGQSATFTYAGAAPNDPAGLMLLVVQIPAGVQPGGYVPVVLQVGNASTVNGAAWVAVSGN